MTKGKKARQKGIVTRTEYRALSGTRSAGGSHFLFRDLAAHPYLWVLGICLFLEPVLILGAEPASSVYALWIETLVVAGVTAVFGIYVVRSRGLRGSQIATFALAVTLSSCFAARTFWQAELQSRGFAAICGVAMLAAVVFMMFFALRNRMESQADQMQINALMIIGLGFFLKVFYVVITTIYTRQHDVGSFGDSASHAGYIQYLLDNHHLPDFDVRGHSQLYHPPLHHLISAMWVFIHEKVLMLSPEAARESLQVLTLFYSTSIVISGYRLFRYFKLEGWALYVPLVLISFHPAFILFAGSINNDVLSVALVMGAAISALEWYEAHTTVRIVKIALCVGLGMMTKLSAAIVALPIMLLFLVVLFKSAKDHRKMLVTQYVIFGLVSLPLGLWFGIRNYLVWGVPLTYIAEVTNPSQYVGNLSFVSRITDFSLSQFASPFIQWEPYDLGCTEYNPLVSLLKTAVFGEHTIINENSPLIGAYGDIIPFALLWTNAVLSAFGLISMGRSCLRKTSAERTAMLFLAALYVVMVLSFYVMAAKYPYTCTMNFRYVTPTVTVGALFIGIYVQSKIATKSSTDTYVIALTSFGAYLFAVLSSCTYLSIV